MKNKISWIYVGIAFIMISMVSIILVNKRINFNSLGASVYSTEEQDSIIISSARKMIRDNINNYDGEVVFTINDLIANRYLSDKDVEKEINRNDRVIAIVKKHTIEDIYIKGELLINKFKCDNVCYMNEENYIAFNNDIYRILKVDFEGNIYITNNEWKEISFDKIDSLLVKERNNLDSRIISGIDLLTIDDIKNSKMLELEDNIYIKEKKQYKTYNVLSNSIDENPKKKANVMFLIKLNNVTYEMGNGTEFNPYVINK